MSFVQPVVSKADLASRLGGSCKLCHLDVMDERVGNLMGALMDRQTLCNGVHDRTDYEVGSDFCVINLSQQTDCCGSKTGTAVSDPLNELFDSRSYRRDDLFDQVTTRREISFILRGR